VDSFTRESLVRLKGSQVVVSLERLEVFSARVAALVRAAAVVVNAPGASEREAARLLDRVLSSVVAASARLSSGSCQVAQQGLLLRLPGPGEDVRKDSTPTSPII